MKRSILATALTAVLASVLFAPAPAAQAGGCTGGVVCGVIKHYTPDAYYDPAILIRCDFGKSSTNKSLYEGESSKKYCADTDEVYVRSGEEIWCKYYSTTVGQGTLYSWVKKFDATGWHKISNAFNDGAGCTLRKD